MTKAKKDASFEKDLEQLEAIVTALEEGGLSLDESLKRFEEGINLARRCEKALGEAEKKIEILTKNAEGELETKPFGEDTEPQPVNRRLKRGNKEASEQPPAPADEPKATFDLPEESEDEERELLF